MYIDADTHCVLLLCLSTPALAIRSGAVVEAERVAADLLHHLGVTTQAAITNSPGAHRHRRPQMMRHMAKELGAKERVTSTEQEAQVREGEHVRMTII